MTEIDTTGGDGGAGAPPTATPPGEPEGRVPWVMAEPRELDEGEEANNPLGLLLIVSLFALLWFRAGPRYFLVVVGILIMILLHELGHFLTARWTGMKATQFFLFMGPRVASFRRGETEYGIRLLPVGAFVRIVGMTNLDPCEPGDEPRAYMNKSYPRKMLVITAGSMMHFIQAVILFVVLSSVIGVRDTNRWSVGEISMLETGETPAVEAELEPGDTIAAVNGDSTVDFADLQQYLRDRPGEQVTLEIVDQAGVAREATIELAALPADDGSEYGFLGVAPEFERTRLSPAVGLERFGVAMYDSLVAIPRFLSPSTFFDLGSLVAQGSADVDINSDEAANRPVSMLGIIRIAGQSRFNWEVPVTMLAFINIFVGIFNLLPLLPLDGGHAAIATYERIRSRKGARYQMDVTKLLPLTYVVVLLFGFLMLTTLWLDLVRPIS